jgi:hypothetical protein
MSRFIYLMIFPLLVGCATSSHLNEQSAFAFLRKAVESGSNYSPHNRDALVRACALAYLTEIRGMRPPSTPPQYIESEVWVYVEDSDKEPLRVFMPGVPATRPLIVRGVRFRSAGGGRVACLLGGPNSFNECSSVYLLDGDTDTPNIVSKFGFPMI